MRRLYRYLASVTLPRAAGALLLVCVIYASIDLVEAGSLAPVSAEELLSAYPLKLPGIAAQMLPLALLFGVLLAVSSLRRGGEWDALRSAGLSPLRLGSGLLVVPLLGFALALPLVEWIAPAALARFHSEVGLDAATEDDRPRWAVDGDGTLSRFGEHGAREVLIERDPEGRAVAYREAGENLWRRGEGWSASEARVEEPAEHAVVTHSQLPLGGGTAGADLTRPELGRSIEALEHSGQDASALIAQGGLRVALIAACLLVPLLGLLFTLGWREGRASRLIAFGLVVGAAYWLAVATAWNGAVIGVWSALWVSVGVPVLFGVLSLLAGLRAARG